MVLSDVCWLCGNSHPSDVKDAYLSQGEVIKLCRDKRHCNATLAHKGFAADMIRKTIKPVSNPPPPDRRSQSAGSD